MVAWWSVHAGESRFSGTSSYSRLDLAIRGSRSFLAGICPFTLDATALLQVSEGAGISGYITYTRVPTVPGCEWLACCQSMQTLSGTVR